MLDRCRELGWSLATAESCTGGLVAAGLTAIPGSTDVVTGGIVAYANEVKVGELDVPAELIERHGAVSAEVAEAMARGARERLGVDVAALGDRRSPARAAAPRRSRSGSSTSTPRRPRRAREAPSASPATATRSGGVPSSPRCTCCGVFWNRIETKPYRDAG